LSPPADHPELVTREITNAVVRSDGRISTLEFEGPMTFSGRLDATCVAPLECDRMDLQATVTVTRSSLFAGGPGFKAVADAEMSNDGAKFSLKVPHPDAVTPFFVTIVPQPRGDDNVEMSVAQFVPPMHMRVDTISDGTKPLTLGAIDLSTIEGTLLGSSGSGLAHYRVVAMGRWEEGSAPVEVSTVAYTGSDGAFRLFISKDVTGTVEIVARSTDPDVVAPVLHLAAVSYSAAGVQAPQRTLSQPANLGSPTTRHLHIGGVNGSGSPVDIVGARVHVGATVPTPEGGTAVFAAEGMTGDDGSVDLALLDGALAQSYTLEVVPPASATVGAIYAQPFSLSDPTDIILPSRVRVRGVVLDAAGKKLEGVSVTARPASRFAWNLDDNAQTFLNGIALSTAVTNESGEYVVWVDPALGDVPAVYDLSLDPPRSTGFRERTPTWIESDVEISQVTSGDTVSNVTLPDAAFIHGDVVDSVGTPVPNAEVKMFRISTPAAAVCSSVQNPPSPCPSNAVLLGRGTASAPGAVELTLPR
jgi:hypothetical protein